MAAMPPTTPVFAPPPPFIPGVGVPSIDPNAQGLEVVIVAANYRTPQSCCRCEGPQETSIATAHYEAGTRTTRTAQMPYCNACAQRHKKITRTRGRLHLLTLTISIAAGLMGLALSMLPMVVLFILPVVLAIGAAVVLTNNFREATSSPNGAWMTGFSGPRTTYYCGNPSWGTKFAALNGAAATSSKKHDAFHVGPPVVAGIVSAILALIIGFGSHPAVYLDNAGDKAMQIWIDGSEGPVVKPLKGLGERPTVRLSTGSHKLGWSKVGAKKPKDEVEASVDFFGDHLLNPEEQGCYWINVSRYGTASTSGMESGVVAVKPFYTFKHIDNWFKNNPGTVSTKSTGATQSAVQTVPFCERMREKECSKSVRARYAKCASKASDDLTMDECAERAAKACANDRDDDDE
ncbi:MAG: hypothetical protein ACHREM_17660 [Polyangiales bacterium]